MVFGFFDGSIVIFAFKKIRPAVVTVVSSPLQILFICLSISSGIGWPSAMPDIIDHSPCNWAMSFLMASLSAAAVEEMVTVASQMRNAIGIILVVFMSEYFIICAAEQIERSLPLTPALSLGERVKQLQCFMQLSSRDHDTNA